MIPAADRVRHGDLVGDGALTGEFVPPFWQVTFWTSRRAEAFDQRCYQV